MSDAAPGLFGELATARGWVDAADIAAALDAQAELRRLGLPERVGEILRKRGLLTTEQVRELLLVQGAGPLRDLVPGYEIQERLGQGGMGAVYRARRRADGTAVALKLLPPRLGQNPEFVARFVREARAAAALRHPNIVAGIDAGCADEHYFVAMELVEGESLDQRLRRTGTLDESQLLTVARAVANALVHAHAEGLVHRDVKPANILIARTPEAPDAIDGNGAVKLCDLGLAKWVADGGTAVTQTGLVLGTPQYVAPEQALGAEDVDIRADLYALGATLYHAATGQAPFTGGSGADVALRRLVADPTPARELNPALSAGCAALIEQLMAREPSARPATPTIVVDAIDTVQRGEPWPPDSPAPPAPRRMRLGLVATLAGLVLAGATGAAIRWRGGPTPPAPAPAAAPTPVPSAAPPAADASGGDVRTEIRRLEASLTELSDLEARIDTLLGEARARGLHDQIQVDELIVFLGIRRQIAELRERLAALDARSRESAAERILRNLDAGR